ncbi:apolipoprotein N-acyltransferase [Microbacterium sp. H83]|uniref:apolipoprotein N-acyltransferase n=1 Tax=Microbacterium sp. H83 TaxID=1827324 RepID=UPI000A9688DE|nr:apolipoprotein N-acyltransferase [Microbacterium sp. H83]
MRPLITLWLAVPLAAAAGLAMDLASPELSWWPLAFVSVIVALATTVGRSIGGALLVGLVFGVTFYSLHLDWVGEFLGPVPRIALVGLQSMIFGIGAIPIALAYKWTSRLRRGAVLHVIVVPVLIGVLWVGREITLGSWPYGGFPWARLGMTQVEGPFPEVASWVGVTGLSLVIATISASVVQWLRMGLRFLPATAPAVLLLVGLTVIPQFPTTDAGAFRVGWVQGNGPSGYFDDRSPGELLSAQVDATEPLLDRKTDLLVWPEGSAEFDPFRDERAGAVLDEIVTRSGSPLLGNAATTRGAETFNTSFVWTQDSLDPQIHDKVNPVPFGEYVPDRWFYEQLAPDLVGLIQREYTPGTNAPVVTVGKTAIGLAICFDVIFDGVIRAGAERDVGLFVFQTNNADFRGSDENLQQLAFARMRAIQTGKSVVNVSTVGTSQVIAPDGSILATAGVDEVAAEITDVPLRTGTAPGIFVDQWTAPGIVILGIGAIVGLAIHSRRRSTRLAHLYDDPTRKVEQ